MFNDPVLFHRWGIDWYLTKVFLAVGLGLMILGGILFAILVIHTGAESRRLDAEDAGDTAFNAGNSRIRYVRGKGVGRSLELRASIGSLREAARRGDWATFWLWPMSTSCWILGIWLLFSTFLRKEVPVIWVVTTVFCLGMEAIFLFMPWAAIYTKIEMAPPAEQSAPAPRR